MSKNCDDIVVDWWKNKSTDYTLDDIFYLNSFKKRELHMEVNNGLKK
jgi:hypothetical protein